eukprot:tig00000076_g2305.t1
MPPTEATPLLQPTEGGSLRGSSRRTSADNSVRAGSITKIARVPVAQKILSKLEIARYQTTLALTILAAVLAPYRIAFLSDRTLISLSPVMLFVVFLDVWFMIDWCFDVRDEYEAHREDDDEAPLLVRLSHVFGFRLVYRFVASLPYGSAICPALCGYACSDGPMVLEVLRLLRLVDVHEAMKRLERSLYISYYTARLSRFFALVLFHAHWTGCVWWFLARIDGLTDHTWVGRFSPDLATQDHTAQYLRSLYFSFVVYASIGFGDIAAVSKSEEASSLIQTRLIFWLIQTKLVIQTWLISTPLCPAAFLVCVIMLNLALGAYVVGNVAALATSADAGVATFRGKARRFPRDLAQRIAEFQRLAFETHDPYHEILDDEDLPYAYRLEVAEHLNRPLLEAGTLFRGCADAVLAAVAVSLRPLTYAPGSLGQVESGARQLFVVGYGRVELVSEVGGASVARAVGEGEAFGVAGFFFQTPLHLEVRRERRLAGERELRAKASWLA